MSRPNMIKLGQNMLGRALCKQVIRRLLSIDLIKIYFLASILKQLFFF